MDMPHSAPVRRQLGAPLQVRSGASEVNESGGGDRVAIPQDREVAGRGAPAAEGVPMSEPIRNQPKQHFSETDDYMMLVEANARRPFEQPHGQVLKEWNNIANILISQSEFSKKDATGKALSARFKKLIEKHRKWTRESDKKSGVDEEETELIMVLDDVTAAYDDSLRTKDDEKEKRASTEKDHLLVCFITSAYYLFSYLD